MKRYTIFLLLFSLLSTSVLYATPGKTRKDKIETLKIWKLVDFLQLTDEQADRFLPRFRHFEKDIRDLQKDKNRKILLLLDKTKKGNEKGLNRNINDILDVDIKMARKKKDFFNSIKGILSEEQTAKIIVFEYQFRREIRHMIEKRANLRDNIKRR